LLLQSWKSDNFIGSNKEKKSHDPLFKTNKNGQLLLLQRWKSNNNSNRKKLIIWKIILHFGCTNTILQIIKLMLSSFSFRDECGLMFYEVRFLWNSSFRGLGVKNR
jgi:hypothetical protein